MIVWMLFFCQEAGEPKKKSIEPTEIKGKALTWEMFGDLRKKTKDTQESLLELMWEWVTMYFPLS